MSACDRFVRQPHWLSGWHSPPLQLPQSTVPPQPSEIFPHSALTSLHVRGWHGPWPQRLGFVAPHVSPVGQLPQSRKSPQPSATSPQTLLGKSAHVLGCQHSCSAWTHTSPPGHVPQFSTAPQPSGRVPHFELVFFLTMEKLREALGGRKLEAVREEAGAREATSRG